jgi:signal transduction histidine kinase
MMRRMAGPSRLTRSMVFKTYAYFGAGLLAVGVFVFTAQLVDALSSQVRTTSHVFARFCAQASFPATRDTVLRRILTEVIGSLDFPIVITDTQGKPRAWRQVGVDQALVPDASIDSLDSRTPPSPLIAARLAQVRVKVRELDRKNAAIPMYVEGTHEMIGELHYGDQPLLERLRWLPWLELGAILVFVGVGLWGLAGIRQSEQRAIWVGMAKETAHQLGTPLSSLLGWIELLRSRADEAGAGPAVTFERQELEETLVEMESDADRLNKVAQRFSRVGSRPQLQLQDVTPVAREAVQYLRRRIPHGEGEMEIRERYEEVPPVNVNRELLEWAIENLLTNALSALDKRPGIIEVVVERRRETEAVELSVTDNGRGMTPTEQRRIFEPGYTTKRRGWGLGLALARRVVQDYHGGRLFIRDSAPGQGTSVVISLPT